MSSASWKDEDLLSGFGEHLRYPECYLHEELTVGIRGQQATARIDALNGELLSLIELLEDLSRDRFGKRYMISIVERATQQQCEASSPSSGGATDFAGTTWFLVRDQQGEVVEHARVFLVTPSGTTLVADRTKNGLLVGEFPDLPTNLEGALLACAEGYYCAGWLLNDPFIEADLHAVGGTISITLTPLVLH